MINNSFFELLSQTFEFPNKEFEVKNDQLLFNNVDLMNLVEKYGAPLRVTYLPKITQKIKEGRGMFLDTMKELNYSGSYEYAYCTKCSHFKFILEEAIKNDISLEISSEFDIEILKRLSFNKNKYVLANGFKNQAYMDGLIELRFQGYNVLSILDDIHELDYFAEKVKEDMFFGLRVAVEEEPQFSFYTSRMGIGNSEVLNAYKYKMQRHGNMHLKMLHFFVETGMKDSTYFWNEFRKAVNTYCLLKESAPHLDSLNLGGGLPFKDSLEFDYDFKSMIRQMLEIIQETCKEYDVPEPNLFTEFGKYTVAESGAHIFEVIGDKQQNDRERWYIINSSIITTIPDVWGMKQRFITLPLNRWGNEYVRANIGGLTCDNEDYYNADVHVNQLFMPKKQANESLLIGFFHTGAYQESLSGYGGVKHCLIPSPKHVVIREEEGVLKEEMFAEQQDVDAMLKILGY